MSLPPPSLQYTHPQKIGMQQKPNASFLLIKKIRDETTFHDNKNSMDLFY